MDFLVISERPTSNRKNVVEVYPSFKAKNSKDLMIRGGDFYAIWNDEKGLWSTSQDDVVDLIDSELDRYAKDRPNDGAYVAVRHMWNADTGMIDKWHKYVQRQVKDNYHPLDEKLVFANSPVNKNDYASKRLPYALEPGDISAYEELISTLYSPIERHKIEWAIGSIVNGDSKVIQKFLVFYGAAGTGKSTMLNIIQELFDGYYSTFDAKALASGSDAFALEAFKSDPLVAIQHDGDLSKIEDNTRLNSIVSHEEMMVNEKFKSQYSRRYRCMLFMGTNRPVKITDGRSGIIRRLIDVSPTEKKIPLKRYKKLMEQIKFELGGIAYHCLQVYEADKDAYENYVPKTMIGATNDFYNFVEEHFDEYKKNDCVTLIDAWADYQRYCTEAKVPYPYNRRVFKEELKTYFRVFKDRYNDNGRYLRNYYSGFRVEKFGYLVEGGSVSNEKNWIELKDCHELNELIFQKACRSCLAQYANEEGAPITKWSFVKTTLKDIDEEQVHYVRVPENHIVIDFDLCDSDGKKSLEKNIEAASKWKPTYAEVSKGGNGIHLHYLYSGDVTKLSRVFDDNIEVKVFTGKSSLRRRLSKCNDIPIATISSGLPLKGEDKVINFESLKNEKALRTLIKRAMNKEYEPYATKTNIDLIFKTLEDAYASGIKYDVTDLRPAILSFGAKSTNNAGYCIKKVNEMKFKSEEPSEWESVPSLDTKELIFFDVEVFPNLFVLVWKAEGDENKAVKMINPTQYDIEELLKFNLVGFNNRRYDNHILYARLVGYSNEKLFDLSQRIIAGSKNAFFGEAYNLSYTDIYDFSSKKQSLKKWEIELGIHHQELGLSWAQPVPEELWDTVANYCVNDVIATEAVWNACKADFAARKILANIANRLTGSGSVNDTTNQLTTKIIFRGDKNPQSQFVYTDLSTIFPGYKFENGKSWYRDEDPKEGGYVYSEPGMYTDVALLDIASMHPSSIENLNLFGMYTKNFSDIKQARIFIKHGDFDSAGRMFDGALKPYLTEELADALSYALKIAINSVYGLTSAKFDNAFKDPRNKDNIVAKRGALFMINLRHEIQNKGFVVAHIKTDSIKIPNATLDIIKFVVDYGKEYGYSFEHEATYEKMCLVNDAVYIAKYASVDHCHQLYGEDYVNRDSDTLKNNKKHPGRWTATGTQFQVPYVFKTLFSHEPIEFTDLCETKTVTTALYLDMNEDLGDEHDYHFIGKAGSFCPIKPTKGGGILCREQNGKYNAATGSKGYRWLESEMVKELHKEEDIDKRYYQKLVDEAVSTISEYGDFEWFAA